MYSVETQDKGVIHTLGGLPWDFTRFYPATQDSIGFKTSELLISGIDRLIFLDHS